MNHPVPEPSNWEAKGGGALLSYRITRTFTFPDITTPDGVCTLRIDVGLDSSSEMNGVEHTARLHLRPFPLSTNKLFVMGFFTSGSKGGFLEIEAIPNIWEPDEALTAALCVHQDDVTKFLRALLSGGAITFVLLDVVASDLPSTVSPPFDPYVKLILPNDLSFGSLYKQTIENLTMGEDATRARHISEGWYRRRQWS